jgi:hypothetical protein
MPYFLVEQQPDRVRTRQARVKKKEGIVRVLLRPFGLDLKSKTKARQQPDEVTP